MKTRSILAAALAVGALALSPGAPAKAANATDLPYSPAACSGPVLTASSSDGVTAESINWRCTDAGTGHSAAVLYFNSATTFWGSWYDNLCNGDVHGDRVGSVLVGRVDFVRCSGVPGFRQGQFTLTYSGLVGEMTVTYM
ncbi:MAG: hypothetical protein QOK43_2572 [Acidimicrobiaceae bacterium]|jgi:hypothetical protein|nr:hypothetical protein [Acidimicrobiaceae bacterium]